MKTSLAVLYSVLLVGTCLAFPAFAQASDSEQVLRRLAALEQENAALRERVRRLENRQGAEQSQPQRSTTPAKDSAAAGIPPGTYAAVYKAAPAVALGWSGPYVGGHIGWGRQTAAVDDPFSVAFFGGPALSGVPVRDVNLEGFFGGGQVGWNYQIGSLVVGTQVSIASGLSGSRSDTIAATFFDVTDSETRKWTAKTDWLGTATTRLGYAWDRWLVYTKGGIAASRTKYRLSDLSAFTLMGVPLSTTTTLQTGADSRVGWTFGGGAELALSEAWSAMIEYDYLDFGNKPVIMSGTTTTSGFFGPITSVIVSTLPVEQRMQMLKLGLNYRFGSTPAAVAANY